MLIRAGQSENNQVFNQLIHDYHEKGSGAKRRLEGLKKAKHNLKHDFQVVGVMEEMDAFLTNVILLE
jgi:hypothetical protein